MIAGSIPATRSMYRIKWFILGALVALIWKYTHPINKIELDLDEFTQASVDGGRSEVTQ